MYGTCPSMTVTEVLPSRILLLALTEAPFPMAVAFVKSALSTSAWYPMAVLLLPVSLLANA